MMITKAKFMIASATNPKKSSLLIITNAVSTIAPPPLFSLTTKVVEQYVYIKE